jgi:hypothetical protein
VKWDVTLIAKKACYSDATTGILFAMSNHLAARFGILAGALLPWIFSLLLARQGSMWLRTLKDWLKRIAFVLFAFSAFSYVADNTRLSSLLSVYGWGFFVAANWLQNRYKFEHPSAPISLNISRQETAKEIR